MGAGKTNISALFKGSNKITTGVGEFNINLFNSLKNINAYKIAGGGDTLNAINTFKLDKNFTYLSSGGGASLEYISSDHLEAIDYLENIEKE